MFIISSLQLMLPVRRNDAAAGLESTALPSKHWACVVLAHVSLTREPHCQPQKVYNDMLTLDLRMCIRQVPSSQPQKVYNDLLTNDKFIQDLPKISLYACGFPCPPWSRLRNRTLRRCGLLTVLDNVPGFVDQWGKLMIICL